MNSAVIGGLSQVATGSSNGHGILGTASLQQQLGQHMSLQLGYTHLHQNYNVRQSPPLRTQTRNLSRFHTIFPIRSDANLGHPILWLTI